MVANAQIVKRKLTLFRQSVDVFFVTVIFWVAFYLIALIRK